VEDGRDPARPARRAIRRAGTIQAGGGAADRVLVGRRAAQAGGRYLEMTTPRHHFLIIADGDFGPLTSKTANSCIRYFPERIVAVFDRKQAGRTVQEVLGFGGGIPVVGDFERGLPGAPPVPGGVSPAGRPRPPPVEARPRTAAGHEL